MATYRSILQILVHKERISWALGLECTVHGLFSFIQPIVDYTYVTYVVFIYLTRLLRKINQFTTIVFWFSFVWVLISIAKIIMFASEIQIYCS